MERNSRGKEGLGQDLSDLKLGTTKGFKHALNSGLKKDLNVRRLETRNEFERP